MTATVAVSAKESLCLPYPRLAGAFYAPDESSPEGISFMTDEALFDACGTRVCFSARQGGVSTGPYASLNLSTSVGDEAADVQENKKRLLVAAGGDLSWPDAIVPTQVHGDDIVTIGASAIPDSPGAPAVPGAPGAPAEPSTPESIEAVRERAVAGVDAIVCSASCCPVLLCFADCVPVVIVAPSGAFAVVHAGWRGALAGIARKALGELCTHADALPSSCNSYIGPHIGSCCYEVDPALVSSFVDAYGRSCDAGGGHLDLTAAIVAQLVSAGAAEERIADAAVCTSCSNDSYFSYRAQDGLCGRHGALAFNGF